MPHVTAPPQDIRRLHIVVRRAVDRLPSGLYRSLFKGHGIEFDGVREYVHGEDARAIDWRASARIGRPVVKQFVEERELTLYLLVDISASQDFGDASGAKRETAARVAAILAATAARSNDRVGLVLFTDRIEHVVPPGKGRRHALRIMHDALTRQAASRGTSLEVPLRHVLKVARPGALVAVISDMRDSGYERALAAVAARHDPVVLRVVSPAERVLPDAGIWSLRTTESEATVTRDFGAESVRNTMRGASEDREADLRRTLARARVDTAEFVCGGDLVLPLLELFRRREHEGARFPPGPAGNGEAP